MEGAPGKTHEDAAGGIGNVMECAPGEEAVHSIREKPKLRDCTVPKWMGKKI